MLTRILWLDGLDEANANTHDRYIYIHGTNQEHLLGQQASFGCIRMRNAEVAELYDRWKKDNPGRDRMPDILKCFSGSPVFLKGMLDVSYPLHFEDGALTRRVKEMIATYVSALNQCPY